MAYTSCTLANMVDKAQQYVLLDQWRLPHTGGTGIQVLQPSALGKIH